MAKVLKEAQKVYITPYIATEVSNLIDLDGYAGKMAYQIAAALFNNFEQIQVDINNDTQDLFEVFGLTDNSLIRLVSDYTILTDDLRLASQLFSVNANNVALLPTAYIKH